MENDREIINKKVKQFCLRLSLETIKKLESVAGDNLQEKIIYLINRNYDVVNNPIKLTDEQIQIIIDSLKDANDSIKEG